MAKRKKKKVSPVPAVALMGAFMIFTFLVSVVDVKPIGPMESEVGFAALNGRLRDAIGFSERWYGITDKLGLLALAVVGALACIGAYQLFTRKKLASVDKSLLVTGCYFIVVLAAYVIFEKLALNYRPVILDEGLEASYPSSHTVLICCVMAAAARMVREYFRNRKAAAAVWCLCVLLIPVTVIGRLLSGVHWFTDILGGLILSASLIAAYLWAMDSFVPGRRT